MTESERQQAAYDCFHMAVNCQRVAADPSATAAQKREATMRWLIFVMAEAQATGQEVDWNRVTWKYGAGA